MRFEDEIAEGIPATLPPPSKYKVYAASAPARKPKLSNEDTKLALRNALRYFPASWHAELIAEFLGELKEFGHIYMHRFKPTHKIYARSIASYPAKCNAAAAIMLMIQNNLDPAVAQHPDELITYGGNGAVFQNWAQYRITMQYLSRMSEEQTLHIYSGHPMGLFPSGKNAPRVVVTNGMMIPNYSNPADYDTLNALGVTQYGQMTAGSYMYIGPQGIVHGTTITVMNAFRRKQKSDGNSGRLFVTSGLGGMSGAQPKAGNIAGCITVCAEVNAEPAEKRHAQGWVDELFYNMDLLIARVRKAQKGNEIVSLAYVGNVVEVWEAFYNNEVLVDIGSDQTSLHNPFGGGYYPAGMSFEEAKELMQTNAEAFKQSVQQSLRRHADAINKHAAKGTYFFDYGNAFLLEASRAGADVMNKDGNGFRYNSYVQDILGPMCFDYGFGPFRWVCTSGKEQDLKTTDDLALKVMRDLEADASENTRLQISDNIRWIEQAENNKLVVGSQARILYADAIGRIKIAEAFNKAIADGTISAPVVLGRDHHDVSGTDSPYRETSNIYDGSNKTADMAIHNVIGDSFRGATWVSIHNGGGVGWGEVINGGFGLLLDGSSEAQQRLQTMLFFDVNNGIARRSWARNKEAMEAMHTELARTSELQVTMPNLVDENLLNLI